MFEVFGFYKFIKIKSLKKNKDSMQKFLIKNNIRGTIIIAKEGLNGTISGQYKDTEKTIKKLKSLFSFKNFDNKNNSKSKFQPFHKPKIKIKGTKNIICLISSYKWTFLNIKIKGINKVDIKILPKIIDTFLFLKIFFSVNGIVKIPINIIIGILTSSQIGI